MTIKKSPQRGLLKIKFCKIPGKGFFGSLRLKKVFKLFLTLAGSAVKKSPTRNARSVHSRRAARLSQARYAHFRLRQARCARAARMTSCAPQGYTTV